MTDENAELSNSLDQALALLADAIPDPKGAIDSPQWHRRLGRLRASLTDSTAREFNDALQNPVPRSALEEDQQP